MRQEIWLNLLKDSRQEGYGNFVSENSHLQGDAQSRDVGVGGVGLGFGLGKHDLASV